MSRTQRSNREWYRRRRLAPLLTALIEEYDEDDLNEQALALGRQCGLSEAWTLFELRWQLGLLTLDGEESEPLEERDSEEKTWQS